MAERRKISRRDFLKMIVIGGGAILAGDAPNILIDPVFRIDFEGRDELTFESAAALALRFDKALDKVDQPHFDNTNRGLLNYSKEIIPQFSYEDVVKYVRWPEILEFKIFEDGVRANHVLGTSNCDTKAFLNGRYEIDTSKWKRGQELFTLIHELAHIQQGEEICDTKGTELVENSAQVGAMEVAAGLANQGNPEYFWAAVNELRRMAIRSAEYLATKEKRQDEFQKLRKRLSPGAISQSLYDKDERYWATDLLEKDRVFKSYGLIPLQMIITAIRKDGGIIDNLAFRPKFRLIGSHSYIEDDYRIKLDDTAYLIENLEYLANGFAR